MLQMIADSEEVIQEDGFLELEKMDSIASLGLDGYYQPKLIERLPYAKPDIPIKCL